MSDSSSRSKQEQIDALRAERDQLAEQIRSGQETIARAKELIARLDDMLAKLEASS
jgi:outer membrane murein-binding lipoprotein Lpp